MNTQKLNQIREAHERLRDLYAGLSARARKARSDAIQLRTYSPSITATPAQREIANRVLSLPPAELLALAPEVLHTLGITPAMINKGVEAQRHADSLQREVETMLSELHASGALLSKLNDYVRAAQ